VLQNEADKKCKKLQSAGVDELDKVNREYLEKTQNLEDQLLKAIGRQDTIRQGVLKETMTKESILNEKINNLGNKVQELSAQQKHYIETITLTENQLKEKSDILYDSEIMWQ